MPGHYKKKGKVEKVMGEYKRGSLHSGKKGPVVKSRKQAIAIALSEAREAGEMPKMSKSSMKRLAMRRKK